MRQFRSVLLSRMEIAPSWHLASFAWPEDLALPQPGQFFTFMPRAIRTGDSGLLRRPLAFAGFWLCRAWTIFQARGPGTSALAATKLGDEVDLIAPLGRGFPLPEAGESPILLGGGIGIGPMLFLHSHLKGLKGDFAEPALHLGFRTAAQAPDAEKLADASAALSEDGATLPGGASRAAGRLSKVMPFPILQSLIEARYSSDDGSLGIRGTVLDSISARLPEAPARAHYYACGPAPMLAASETRASREGARIHVSVEQWMACGVGACQGCVLPATSGGYVRACADGPVFEGGIIRWA